MKFEWEIQGAGFAIILTEIFKMIGIFSFIQFTEYKRTIFKGIKILPDIPRIKKLGLKYCKTSIPILVHIYCAYIIFVLLTFVALSLNTPSVNTHLALQTVSGTFFRLQISLSIADMIFGDFKRSKQYFDVGILIVVLTYLLFRISTLDDYWSLIVDGLQGTLSGALKGINKADLVQYSTIFAYFICCVPIASFFAYDWELGNGTKGIWLAFGIQNLILTSLFTFSLIFTDWKKVSERIINRIKRKNEMLKKYYSLD